MSQKQRVSMSEDTEPLLTCACPVCGGAVLTFPKYNVAVRCVSCNSFFRYRHSVRNTVASMRSVVLVRGDQVRKYY